MNLLKYIFLAVLVFVTIVHLYDSYKDNTKQRPKTKWALLLLIIGYYLASVKSMNIAASSLLIAALATSWLGDVLLIPQGNGWFAAGGISFLASHILFILVYISNVSFENVNFFIVAPIAVLYIAVATTVLVKLKPTTPKWMFVPMFLYLLTNGTMNVFSLMMLVSNPCAATATAYIGAVLFFISDCSLYLLKYYKKPEIVFKKHFTVMLTYVLGEFLITQGIIMLSAMK